MKQIIKIFIAIYTFAFSTNAMAAAYLTGKIPYQWFNGMNTNISSCTSANPFGNGSTNPMFTSQTNMTKVLATGTGTCPSNYEVYTGGFTKAAFKISTSGSTYYHTYSCKPCAAGYYLPANSSTCTQCEANNYCPGHILNSSNENYSGLMTLNASSEQGKYSCSARTGGVFTRSSAGTSTINNCRVNINFYVNGTTANPVTFFGTSYTNNNAVKTLLAKYTTSTSYVDDCSYQNVYWCKKKSTDVYLSSVPTSTDVTRSGFRLRGWTSGNTTSTWIDTVNQTPKITATGNIYAQWAPITYPITYNANGGQCSGGSTVNLISAHPAKTWTHNGITVTTTGNGVYTLNGTATGSYALINIPVNQFTMPTTIGGGGQASIALNNEQVVSNSGVLVRFSDSTGNVGGFQLDKLNKFYSASTSISGKNIIRFEFYVASGTTLSNLVVSPAVYNDGRTSAGDFVVSSIYGYDNGCQPVTYSASSSTITLPTPTRYGYNFIGWYTSSSFSGSAVTQIASGSTGAKTYYAKWAPTSCAAGTYLPAGGTDCAPCTAGNYCPGGNVTYSGTTDSGLTACPSSHPYSITEGVIGGVLPTSINDCYKEVTDSCSNLAPASVVWPNGTMQQYDVSTNTGSLNANGTAYQFYNSSTKYLASGCGLSDTRVSYYDGVDVDAAISSNQYLSCNNGYHAEYVNENLAPINYTTTNWRCRASNDLWNSNDITGLAPGEWELSMNGGTIKGRSFCSITTGANTLRLSSLNENKTGPYCWCQATSFTPTGGSAQSITATWFYGVGFGSVASGQITGTTCATDCAAICGYSAANRDTLKSSYMWATMCRATTYTITYNADGGWCTGGNSSSHNCTPTSYTTESSNITLPTPTKTDNNNIEYHFDGWYTNSSFTGNPVTTIPTGSTGNKTFYAKWRPIYDIHYICKRYTNGYDEGGTGQIIYGDIFHASTSNETCEQTGYDFAGWDCKEGTTGNSVIEGQVYQSNHHIYCDVQYNLSDYNIHWYIDGGTWQPEQLNRPTVYHYTDPDITFDNPSKTGYTLLGWCIYDSATNNGANCSHIYNPNNPDPNFVAKNAVAIPHNSTGDRWVYPKWAQNTLYIYCGPNSTITRNPAGSSYTLGSVAYECGLSGDTREYFICGNMDNTLGLPQGDFVGPQEAESVDFTGTYYRKFCAPAQMITAPQYESNVAFRLRMYWYNPNQGYVITPTGREYVNDIVSSVNDLENLFTASHTETLATFKSNLITAALGANGTGSKFWIANRAKLPGDGNGYQSYSQIVNDLTNANLYYYHDKNYSDIVNIIYGDPIDIKCTPNDASAATTVVWPGNQQVPDSVYYIADNLCNKDPNRRELYCYTVGVGTEYRLVPDITRSITNRHSTEGGETVCYFKDYTCSSGYYLPADSTTCTECEANYYCPGGLLEWSETQDSGKNACPLTFSYSNTGQSAPTSCYARITAYPNGGIYDEGPFGGYPIPYNAYYNTEDSMFVATTEYYRFKTLPTQPTRTGYNFAGWQYTLPPNNLTGLLDTTTNYSASFMEVYAQWTPKQITCQPGYYITAGSENCDTVCPAGSYCTGGTFTYNGNVQGKAPCPTAYPHSDQSSVSMPACYAIITYNLNGGSAIQYNPVEWHYNANYPDYYLINPFPTTTKTGYTVTWWTTSNFQSGTQVDTTTHMIGDQTLYAKWTPNTIDLTWNKLAGDTTPHATNTCTYDGDITLPTEPTRTGFSFAGWKLEE